MSYHSDYYLTNRTRLLARAKARHEANRSEINAQQREYARQNRQVAQERQRKWRQENPEKYRAQGRKQYHKNPSHVLASTARRRAAMRGGSKCTCCTKDDIKHVYTAATLTGCEVDHRKPLALGGKHCCLNLQLLTVSQHKIKTAKDRRLIRLTRELS